MRSFWTEPFLWIHLAGIAALPLTLELVCVGLAVGDPILPVWLELLLVAVVGIGPVVWMQLTNPFDIFSLLIVAMKPEQLTEDRRRLLSLFKTKTNSVVTIAAGIFMVWVLWQLYRVAPVAAPAVASYVPGWRIAGLLWGGLAFLASNLFLQVPLSVVQVLLTSESEWAATIPYLVEKVPQEFTIPGVRVNQIWPLGKTESAAPTTSSPNLSSDQK